MLIRKKSENVVMKFREEFVNFNVILMSESSTSTLYIRASESSLSQLSLSICLYKLSEKFLTEKDQINRIFHRLNHKNNESIKFYNRNFSFKRNFF